MPITATLDLISTTRPTAGLWRTRFGRIVFLACGLLLLAAASLKLIGMNVSPFAQYGWLLTPTVQTAAVVWELLLGVWLVYSAVAPAACPVTDSAFVAPAAGRCSPLPWLLAVLTFVAFAVVSGYLGMIGQANCGCFGLIQASPWAAFAVDIAALLLLALGRPRFMVAGTRRGPVELKWLTGVALVLAALAGIGTVAFGSLDAAVAKLRGEALGTTPSVLDFGRGQVGEMLTTTVTVRNYTNTPVRLIGGTSDCSCITTQDLPQTIKPGGSATIGVKLKVPQANPGQMNRRIELLTDCPQQRKIVLTAGCVVTE